MLIKKAGILIVHLRDLLMAIQTRQWKNNCIIKQVCRNSNFVCSSIFRKKEYSNVYFKHSLFCNMPQIVYLLNLASRQKPEKSTKKSVSVSLDTTCIILSENSCSPSSTASRAATNSDYATCSRTNETEKDSKQKIAMPIIKHVKVINIFLIAVIKWFA